MPARLAYDNLKAAVVRILVGGERMLTARFAALASYYLFEPCFCRPGEGHDKGGVEARGKALCQQALVPIPSGPTLEGINGALLARLDARLETKRDVTGQTIGAHFLDEQRLFRPTPISFEAESTTFATVSRSSSAVVSFSSPAKTVTHSAKARFNAEPMIMRSLM